VVLVPPSTLPKTSSGKLQRSLCKTRYLAREFDRVS
jgi:acyl-CoA synthetase (AMP-forming)/AMP-acid ligase II